MPENRLAIELSIATGMRISDCLSLKVRDFDKGQRFSVKETKTGKVKRIYIPLALYADLEAIKGKVYVFEGRLTTKAPRTRQAVFKDLKRVCKLYRVNGKKLKENLAPHTARKIYAVDKFRQSGDIKKVQKLLNHSDEAVTILYALADTITARKVK